MLKFVLILIISIFTPVYAVADVVSYEIQKDDELMLISKKSYGSYYHWREIVKANPYINPNCLKIGQKIILPIIVSKVEEVQEKDSFTEISVISLIASEPNTEKSRSPGSFSTFKKWFSPNSEVEEKEIDYFL